jgi:putative membrane protein
MGAANVIPGVSGGTIALITNIFERLINAIKSFDFKALKLLFAGKIKEFAKYTDLYFLIAVFAGVVIAIVSLARIFDFLFENYPVYIWAYFFGLVLASVYFVGKTVQRWNAPVIMSFIVGTAIAIAISVLNPATENEGFIYLMLCGVAGICSMILPGLSGSFILFIMGNYKLVVIDAVNNLDAGILLPVAIGAIVGLLAFSHLLSWVLKRYRNQTIALLTGFILGSLRILWPWQSPVYLVDENSTPILKDGAEVIVSYKQYFPDSFSSDVLLAIFWIIIGIVSIALIEYFAAKQAKKV